jgi:hypothetical protein
MESLFVIDDQDQDYSIARLMAEVLLYEDARDKRERELRPWRKLAEHVDEIEDHKNDPWIAIRIGEQDIVRLRAGAMAVLVGGPGSGKSTLAANVLYSHALDVGVAIMHSAELPGLEFTARLIGGKCDASWAGVLTGQVPLSEMRRVTALDRFFVLERKWATLANLRACIAAAQAQFPGQPILICVDYVQIIKAEGAAQGGREERLRVSDIVEALDDIARTTGSVILALSQMSTANAKLARAGEALGNDAGELAAETSAFNRYATVALSIGKKTDPFEDGSRIVELSIGKSRMGEGDKVIPMREWGRSGKWIVEGEAKTAEQVREGRDVEKTAKREKATAAQIVGILTQSNRPLSRNELLETLTGTRADKLRLVRQALTQGAICEVSQRAGRSKSWCVWTSEKAGLAGLEIIRGETC